MYNLSDIFFFLIGITVQIFLLFSLYSKLNKFFKNKIIRLFTSYILSEIIMFILAFILAYALLLYTGPCVTMKLSAAQWILGGITFPLNIDCGLYF